MEQILYGGTFVVSVGLSILGILLAHDFYKKDRSGAAVSFLFYQIFWTAFLLYTIWGGFLLNMLIKEFDILMRLQMRLFIYVTAIALPIIFSSWYMLLNFSFSTNQVKQKKVIPFVSLSILLALAGTLFYTFQVEFTVQGSLLLAIRIFVFCYLLVSIIATLPFILKKRSGSLSLVKIFWGHIAVNILMALAASFFHIAGFYSTCIAILIVFSGSVYLPFALRIAYPQKHSTAVAVDKVSYSKFCEQYEITKRESEIILEICQGKTNQQIAEAMFISLQTVKDHNHRIFTKVGVRSRIQLANLVRK